MRTAFIALLLLATGLGGCKKQQEPATEGTQTTAPAAPVAVTSMNLGRSIGPDKRVVSETTQFGVNDTIYASVATSGTGSATLAARWTYQDGQVVDETTQSISAAGPATTEFHVSKPSGWPSGNYRVEVMLNGTASQSKEFSVQ